MIYKVLWIDDESQKNCGAIFRKAAKLKDIDIEPIDNYIDGLAWLEQNNKKCDAVILDVKCIEQNKEPEDASSDVFQKHLYDVRYHCEKAYNKLIPWFVYTAGDLKDIKGFVPTIQNLSWSDEPLYFKTKDEDRDLLFENIKRAADKSQLFPLKQKYEKELGLCDEYANEILGIADEIYNKRELKENSFNTLRDVMEWIKEYARDHGVFSEKVITLANAATFIQLVNCVPTYIKYTFQATNHITQEGSHSKYAGKSDERKSVPVVKDHVRKGIATQLLEATFNNVMLLLEWCSYLPQKDDEIQRLREITDQIKVNYDDITATLKKDNNIYYCEDQEGYKCRINRQYIEQQQDVKLDELLGKTVTLINVIPNKSNDKDIYPFYAQKLKK